MFDFNKALIPVPKKITHKNEKVKVAELSAPLFKLVSRGDGSDVFCEAEIYLKSALCGAAAINEFTSDSDFTVTLCINKNDSHFENTPKKEAYYISITENGATLCGCDAAGAYYAAVSFKQLLHTEGSAVYLPIAEISDYPSCGTRGHYMESRYGSDFMTLDDWKKAVDYFSEMKINHLYIGVYGCWGVQFDKRLSEFLYIPIKKYPKLKTPRNIKYYCVSERKWIYKKDVLPVMFEKDYLCELIAYGKRKNIKIIPQFNSLGHNSLLPRVFPEISVRDENGNPTGFGFCTANDMTYEIMFDIYDEIIERYLRPNGIDSIEIGLDEIWSMRGISPDDLMREYSHVCKCEKCKAAKHIDLVISYLVRLLKYFKAKGIKNVYAYHDVLFRNNVLNDELVKLLKKEDVYDILVVDWWCYHYTRLFDKREDEVNSLCRSIIKPWTGYFHWEVPTDSTDNIQMCAKLGAQKGMEGLVAYGAYDIVFDRNFLFASEAAWDFGNISSDFAERYAYRYYRDDFEAACKALSHVREFSKNKMWGEGLGELEYYNNCTIHAGEPYPTNYPGSIFTKILGDREKYVSFLENTKKEAKAALDFFENTCCVHKINSMWKMTSLLYLTLANEYLEILEINDGYAKGTIDATEVIKRIKVLILGREKLMLCAENIKIEANTFQLLRNMSINRQCLCDIRDYFIKTAENGGTPKLDIENLEYLKSKIYFFLR